MAYPTLQQNLNSKESQLQGRQVDRASNGVVKVRSMFTVSKKVFDLYHQALTTAQKTTLETFYAANLFNSFAFVWNADGATYTVFFGEGDLNFMPVYGAGYWNCNVQLVQA